MCGICCAVAFSPENKQSVSPVCPLIDKEHHERLKRRGPDSFREESILFEDKASLDFFCSVLHIRGNQLVSQPYKDERGNLLLWNGEIFEDQMQEILTEECDTKFLSCSLFNCDDLGDFLNVFGRIHGPWAFIYWQAEKGLLWFGRDVFGRRSLVYHVSQNPVLCFSVSSTALSTVMCKEVPADGIYCLDVSASRVEGCLVINKYVWSHSASGRTSKSSEFSSFENVPCRITVSDHQLISPIKSPLNTVLPGDFPGHSCYVKNSLFSETSGKELFQLLLQEEVILNAVNEFETHISNAVKVRVENQPFICKDCMKKSVIQQRDISDSTPEIHRGTKCTHSSVGVLFSGGIDSLIIAALVHRYVPLNLPIDLINVAFRCLTSKTKHKNMGERTDFNYETPDRITGKQGTEALKILYSSRQWNFVEINVTPEELNKMRSQHICHILKPSCTVLDDSIGCACWFAARGKGLLLVEGGHQEYISPTRVLLLGMGADEQLAGYSRHRAQFSSDGWQGVIDELALELDRISSRNLGRDDRIISDHGREARFPFLDERVVSFLNDKPVWLKANLNYSRGIGEKLLLRLLLYKLGLKEAAFLPKRAIQFGSRIARSENNREKGSDHCQRLLSAIQSELC